MTDPAAQQDHKLSDLEPTLADQARRTVTEQPIGRSDPQPRRHRSQVGDPAVRMSNRQLKVALWGPPEQLTLSLGKTDVWDRRRGWERPLTLEEIRRGAFDSINAFTVDEDIASRVDEQGRPKVNRPWGYLSPEGGRVERYMSWWAYDYPCAKPVGQVQFRCPDLAAADQPTATVHCGDGRVEAAVAADGARARLTWLVMMTRNLAVLEGELSGLRQPAAIRLFRHRDTVPGAAASQLWLEPPQIQALTRYDYGADSEWNGPVAPPECGCEEDLFWIRQVLPPEKTFPNGFEYVLAGTVVGAGSRAELAEGQPGLGTLPENHPDDEYRYGPHYEPIRRAEGWAATAYLLGEGDLRFRALFTVVTSAESDGPLAEARRRLTEERDTSPTALREENAAWYRDLYARREHGRVFTGDASFAEERTRKAFASWSCPHSSGTLPDPRRLECDVSYAWFEQDVAPWHGMQRRKPIR